MADLTHPRERLAALDADIKALEAERAALYKASVDAPDEDKLCPDFMAEMLSEPLRMLEYPITVSGITTRTGSRVVKPGLRSKPAGSFVAVRPCDKEHEGKTFLGVLLGEIALSATALFHPETGVLEVGLSMHNPAIWVPDLARIVFGMESWWGVIESPDDLHQITNQDIDNIWYVKAMKDLGEKR